jgi:Flp pilus assembly protein TadB
MLSRFLADAPNPADCPHHHCAYYQHVSGYLAVFVMLVAAVVLVAAILIIVVIRRSRRRRRSGAGTNALPPS